MKKQKFPIEALNLASVTGFVNHLCAQWENSPEAIVFNGMSDPLLPLEILRAKKSKKGELKGFIYQDRIYINAIAADGPVDISRTVIHEAVGHYGLRGVFGSDLNKSLSEVVRLNRPDIDKKLLQYGLPDTEAGIYEAAEEVLADLSESNPTLSCVETAVASIRGWFRKNIPGMESLELSKNELIKDFILPARNFVKNISPQKRAFKEWFKTSKITNTAGDPIVLYHGTTSDIEAFQQNKATEKDAGWYGSGIYFTADPSTASAYSKFNEMKYGTTGEPSRVMPVFASIQNPYYWPKGRPVATSPEEATSIRKELESAGYDGVIVSNENADPEYASHYEVIAFYPNQIKSSIGNNGNYDPHSQDIRKRLDLNSKQTKPLGFDAWCEDLMVIAPQGDNLGIPAVYSAYHGTTHAEITTFQNIGSKEGFLGQGPYFTTSHKDACINYAGIGPDLANKLKGEAETLFSDTEEDEDRSAFLETFYKNNLDINPVIGWDSDCLDEAWDVHGQEACNFMAKEKLMGKSDGLVMPVYIKLKNPADTTGMGLSFTYEESFDEDDNHHQSGTLLEWIESVRRICGFLKIDCNGYISALVEDAECGDINLKRVFELVGIHLDEQCIDYNGDNISSGYIFQKIAKDYGFDGIIMDANYYFGRGNINRSKPMDGVTTGTIHIVPFSPEQVKSSIGNNGDYDKRNPDIRYRIAETA